jgi:hypothetical protein
MKTRKSKIHKKIRKTNNHEIDKDKWIEKKWKSIRKRDETRTNKINAEKKANKKPFNKWVENKFWEKSSFIKWYKDAEPKGCAYCKIKKEKLEIIDELVKQHKIINKRSPKRGRSLEVDRKDDRIGYTKANCCLACYWCNNAKTDTFDEKDFKLIGKAIGNALKKLKNKPKEK